jgi:hypothetical protein
MHGYKMKNAKGQKVSNHAGWRAKTVQIPPEDPSQADLRTTGAVGASSTTGELIKG